MKKIASVAAAAVLGLGSTFAVATAATADEDASHREWRHVTQPSEYLAGKACYHVTTGGDPDVVRGSCTDPVQINPEQWVASYQVNVPD